MNIYIIHHSSDFYKIGKANNINSRLRHLQTSCPIPLKVIAFLPCCDSGILSAEDISYISESKLHKEYQKFNTTNEWFKLDKELVEEIINKYGFIKGKGNKLDIELPKKKGRKKGSIKSDEKFLDENKYIIDCLKKGLSVRDTMSLTNKSSHSVQKVRKMILS